MKLAWTGYLLVMVMTAAMHKKNIYKDHCAHGFVTENLILIALLFDDGWACFRPATTTQRKLTFRLALHLLDDHVVFQQAKLKSARMVHEA
jgi:hypothetical protein